MRATFIPLAAAFYGVLGVAAVVWCWLAGRESVFWLEHPPTVTSALQWGGVGLMFGLVVVLASDLAERRFAALRRLGEAFAEVLGEVTWGQSFVLAALSAFGEEMFFRGAMLPAFGLVGSSAVFALVHWPMDRRLRLWPLFAGAIGLALGWAFQASGHLVGPIVAHFVINFVNLRAVGRR